MVDITMCTQTLCPNAGHCYRIQAKASDWQSMATFNYAVSAHGVECDNYIPTYHAVTMTTTNERISSTMIHSKYSGQKHMGSQPVLVAVCEDATVSGSSPGLVE